MDELDLDSLNYRELYKLHTTGAGTLNWESSDSSDSDSDRSYTSLERNKPLLYTFEEINANLVVIEAKNAEKDCSILDVKISEVVKSRENPNEEYLQKILERLLLPDYCGICYVELYQPHGAKAHYNSITHKYNVKKWKAVEIKESGEIWHEKLHNLTLPDYCYVCSADLSFPTNAKSHYSSKRHRTFVTQWKAEYIKSQVFNNTQSISINSDKCDTTVAAKQNLVEPKNCPKSQLHVNPLCTICGISVGSSLQDHDKSDLHRRLPQDPALKKLWLFAINRDFQKQYSQYNVVCSDHFKKEDYCEQKTEENRSSQSSGNLATACRKKKLYQRSSASSYSEERADNISVKASCTETISENNKMDRMKRCSICNIKFGNDNVAHAHYRSLVHEMRMKKQSVPARWCYCDRCKLPLDGTENAEDHYEDPNHIMKNISPYCHICRVKFASRTEMNDHVKSFPHNVVSNLKSVLVSEGISTQEFWQFNKSEIHCNLCKVIMKNQSTADGHFQSKDHEVDLKTWCSKQPQDDKHWERRWYFCSLCNVLLDGTTNIELHYQGKKHIEQHKRQSSVGQTTTSSIPNTIDTDTENAKEVSKKEKEVSKKIKSNVENPQHNNEKIEKVSNGFENNIRNETKSSDVKKTVSNPNKSYCYVCCRNFSSDIEVASHANSFPHQYAAKLKAELVSKGITRIIFWNIDKKRILCQLCDARIESHSSAVSHFNCLKHKQQYKEWFVKRTKVVKDPNSKWHFCNVCNVFLDGTTNSYYHYQSNGHVINDKNDSSVSVATNIAQDTIVGKDIEGDLESKDIAGAESIVRLEESQSNTENCNESHQTRTENVNESHQTRTEYDNESHQSCTENDNKSNQTLDQKLPFNCYLCKTNFNSQTELNEHVRSFPHSPLSKMKSFLVSKGISKEEYWENKRLAIWCQLCESSLLTESCCKVHFASKEHVDNLVLWCHLQLKLNKESDTKWYFCDICAESLDGTSNAEAHYLEESHVEKEKKNELLLGVASSNGIETNILSKDVTNVDNPPDSNEKADTSNNFTKFCALENIKDNDEDPSQKIVQSEMEKLLVKIQGIPLGKTLNILKKLNDELESDDDTKEDQPLIVKENENIYSENNLVSGTNQFDEEKEKEKYIPNNPSYCAFEMLLWGASALLFLHLLRK